MLVDIGDKVGGGTPGDRTVLFSELVQAGPRTPSHSWLIRKPFESVPTPVLDQALRRQWEGRPIRGMEHWSRWP